MTGAAIDAERLARLFHDGEELRKRHQRLRGEHFHSFVPADYAGCYEQLSELKERADTFLELGSGSGVITILADLLGYDAYGVEIEPWLVDAANQLADVHESEATFATGSFIPHDFRSEYQHDDPDFLVTYDGAAPAYDELGLDLDDFDLVYAYPWPGEEELFLDIVRTHGRAGGLFLTYRGTEGFETHEL